MDVLLIILVVIFAVILLYVSIYLLALYCHPLDSGFGASLFCKALVVLSLALAWLQTILLALDVSNSRNNGALDMHTCFLVVYIEVFSFITLLIPTAIFYYEQSEDKPFPTKLLATAFSQFLVLLFAALIIFLAYFWLQTAEIPIHIAELDASLLEDSSTPCAPFHQIEQDTTLSLQISPILFTLGLMTFVGYLPLVLYGSVGLTYIPFDLIRYYRVRPIVRSSGEASKKKQRMLQILREFIAFGEELKIKEKESRFSANWFKRQLRARKVDQHYAILYKAVLSLEEEYEIFKKELEIQNSNPLLYLLALTLGIILLLLALFWWLHILINCVMVRDGIPVHTFLNKLLVDLQNANLGFLAVFFFGLFTLYLLWSVTQGNIALNLPWIFSFHPMKLNETWMNSLLFNIILILLASVALTHFSTRVFSQYTRLTTLELLFGTQIECLKIFSWAFQNRVYEYSFFGLTTIAAVVNGVRAFRRPSILMKRKYELPSLSNVRQRKVDMSEEAKLNEKLLPF